MASSQWATEGAAPRQTAARVRPAQEVHDAAAAARWARGRQGILPNGDQVTIRWLLDHTGGVRD